jgi:transposase
MKQQVEAGVDVGSKELVVAASRDNQRSSEARFPNTADGHKKLIKFLKRGARSVRVCMEATGLYGFELAVSLHRSGIEVMIVNPLVIARFAEAMFQRGKTDSMDAVVILEYVQRMPFVAWQPPSPKRFELRAIMRRVEELKKTLVKEKNRSHANEYVGSVGKLLARDLEAHIRQLKKRIAQLEASATKIVQSDPELSEMFGLLCSVRGVGPTSALHLLSELAMLPDDLTARQLVAHAGLDPRPFESGTSVRRPRRISKAGNRHLRAALFMPAMVAVQHDPTVRAFHQRIVDRGRHPIQAYVAVMRKFLHVFHAMLRNRTIYDSSRFAVLAA